MTDTKPEEPVEAVAVAEEKSTEAVVAEEKPVEATAEDKTAEKEEEVKTDEKDEEAKKERKGILSDASVLPESDDPAEIVKQVEFYFADSNLRFDKFLYGLVGEENKWVDIALVASFNRMRRFKDLAKIKEALESSELMELNEEKTKMRRKHAMVKLQDPKNVDKALLRSLYAKGFGAETKTSQFDIEKFFEGTGLKVNAVRLRRDDGKIFKGSVFVEFKTSEDLQKFVDLDPKPEWNGKALTPLDPTEDSKNEDLSTTEQAEAEASQGVRYMTKEAFVSMKLKAIEDGKLKPKDYKNQKFDAFKKEGGAHRGGRGGKQQGRGGKRDNRDWRERRDDDRKGGFRNHRGGRGGRGNHGSRGRGGESGSGQKFRADGVPIIRTASDSPAKNLKRGRDEEGGEERKRAKADTASG